VGGKRKKGGRRPSVSPGPKCQNNEHRGRGEKTKREFRPISTAPKKTFFVKGTGHWGGRKNQGRKTGARQHPAAKTFDFNR